MSPAPARVDELKKRYEENPRRFFAPLANEYRKAGDLDAAIDLCRMHLEEQPGHLSGHIVYGQALYESARPADARKAFEAALTLDPENLIALRHLGDIAKADGDATVATQWYQRVLDADPRNDEVIALIADLNRPAPAPTVVIAGEHAPPPVPSYAEDAQPAIAAQAVDPTALTPVIPFEAVAPPPAPPSTPAAARLSIGLMDLDLNLADSTAPSMDLLGAGPQASVEMPAFTAFVPPPVSEPAPAAAGELPTIGSASAAPAGEAPEVLDFDDDSLGVVGASAGAVEAPDTTFGMDIPYVEEPTFANVPEESAFGDSLDVTASADIDVITPQPTTAPLDEQPMVDAGEASAEATVAAPAETPAAPAAPSPGDFDLLFGNAPIADVSVGGPDGAQSVGEVGFVSDSFIGREPTDAVLESAPDVATPPSPFVTETMAELYLQQGFRDEALEVYRQLLAQNPDDTGLAERVRHLEHGARSSLAIDSVSEEIEAAVEAEAQRLSGDIPVVPAVPVAAEAPLELEAATPVADQPFVIERAEEPPTEPVPLLPETVPAFLVEAPVAAPSAVAPAGPTAREIFARIANRRAVSRGGLAPEASAESATPSVAAQGMPTAAEEARPIVTVAPGGGIDRLFGMGGVVAVDEGAAVALSTAFGGAQDTPIRGQPTRAVSGEFSLNSVFKAEEPAATPSGVQRQSTKLRFDQFFSGAEDTASTAPASPPPPVPGKGEDDVAQFTDWLKGLKGT